MSGIDTKKLLVKQIYHDLKNKIISGEYQPGELMPGLKKLQAQYETSLPVINEALELLAAEKMLIRNSPNFRVNDLAQEDQLPHKLKYIAVVIAEIDDFSQIVFNRLEVECRKRNLELLFYRHEMNNELQRQHTTGLLCTKTR